jgi:hypothetical protein
LPLTASKQSKHGCSALLWVFFFSTSFFQPRKKSCFYLMMFESVGPLRASVFTRLLHDDVWSFICLRDGMGVFVLPQVRMAVEGKGWMQRVRGEGAWVIQWMVWDEEAGIQSSVKGRATGGIECGQGPQNSRSFSILLGRFYQDNGWESWLE